MRPRIPKPYKHVYQSDYKEVDFRLIILWVLQWGFYVNLTVYLAYKFDWPVNDMLYQALKFFWL